MGKGQCEVITGANKVQDGHTAAENAVYDYLWLMGDTETEYTRAIRIGAAQIAEGTAMSKASVHRALKGLRAKLAIEVAEDHEAVTMTPRTFRVYSHTVILAAREAAGLRWARRRSGGAVDLLTNTEAKKHPHEEWRAAAWAAFTRPAENRSDHT
ncbi:MAG: hypothetical protein WCF17_12200 [Terracidiphilus sp.]